MLIQDQTVQEFFPTCNLGYNTPGDCVFKNPDIREVHQNLFHASNRGRQDNDEGMLGNTLNPLTNTQRHLRGTAKIDI